LRERFLTIKGSASKTTPAISPPPVTTSEPEGAGRFDTLSFMIQTPKSKSVEKALEEKQTTENTLRLMNMLITYLDNFQNSIHDKNKAQ
jgi:hypothetical protein